MAFGPKKIYNINMRLRYFLPVAFALLTTTSANALSDDQRGAISQHCASIRQSLKSLQLADDNLRNTISPIYHNLQTNFITPLNLRLVRNNIPAAGLTEIQSSINRERDTFSRQFIHYNQDMEHLIDIDCQNNPDGFYTQLESARNSRVELANTVQRINALLSKYSESVYNLKPIGGRHYD